MKRVTYTEQVSLEAGAWLARLQSGELSEGDEAAFQSWLASHPAHTAAFEDATNIWDRLGAIPRDAFGPKLPSLAGLSRRALIFGTAGLAIAGVSVSFLRSAAAQTYTTAVGQQTRVPLADGGALFLDTNTSLTLEWAGDQCHVNLEYGRVNCRVSQAGHQITVNAEKRTIVGDQCVFDVSSYSTQFSVLLIDGKAEVENLTHDPIELRSGDRLNVISSNVVQRDRPNLSLLTAWQTGRLIFRDETVMEAVEQMNRYSTLKVEVDDPNVASMRMSGGYAVGDTSGFAQSLAQLLPIEVRQTGDKILLTARSDI